MCVCVHNVSNRISKEFQPRDHRISSTTQPDRQSVKHPSRNHPVHEQTEVVETAASVGRNRILISGKRGRGWCGGMNSLWKIASNSHSRAIILGDQTGSFTDHSPLLPQAVPPFYLVSSVIRPSSLRWNSHCLPRCLSPSYGFRGRPTDSRFSEKRRKRADSNSANNIIIHFHRGLVIILTMDRD